jgi:hypothetical protein
MISCDLRTVNSEGKKGRYSQTMHWDVKGFGKNRWVVLGYIDLDWTKSDINKEDIVDCCLEYLNKAPERKKYAKKQPTPPYGKLERYKEKFVDSENPYIICEFITDDGKNNNFIGDAPKVTLT